MTQAGLPPLAEGGRRAAVLGKPVAHSLSPALHNAAYQALGLTAWRYDIVECDEHELAEFVGGLGPEWTGLSLTMPLKRVALTVADEVSAAAAAIGAANTLVFTPDGVRADNTDVQGIVRSLREAGVRGVSHAVVLGAGGTAQAALAALRILGDVSPTVRVRNLGHTAELRETADRLGSAPRFEDGFLDRPLPAADVVISTVPAGAADPLFVVPGPAGVVVLDVVYAPWPTPFAAAAAAAGAPVVSGLDMLLHQAVSQVEQMTGRDPAPLAAMRSALDAAVRARANA